MLLAGLALFGIGSLVAGLVGSAGQLGAARAGMGVGGALLLTTTLAVVMQVFAPDEHPRATGIWAAVNALGFAAGPLVGGLVLAHFRWGAIFLINLPVVVLGLVAVAVLVPESKNVPVSPRWSRWRRRTRPRSGSGSRTRTPPGCGRANWWPPSPCWRAVCWRRRC